MNYRLTNPPKKKTVTFSVPTSGLNYNEINHKMSASNEKLLFNVAKSGDLAKLEELLSKGVGTGYRDVVS